MASRNGQNAKKLVGVVLIVIGVGADLIGILGTLTGWGEDTTEVVLAAETAETTTVAPASSATSDVSAAPATEPPTPTTTSPPAETPEGFLSAMGAALASADVEFLVGRLHPAVIERYSDEQCRASVVAFQDPTAAFEVTGVGEPEPYTWVTDGIETEIPATLSVDVIRTVEGAGQSITVHITEVDGTFRWFTDCTPA
ncbi:MAG: hypothetical protein ACT4OX_03625 [Actinomycetota bacterium]